MKHLLSALAVVAAALCTPAAFAADATCDAQATEKKLAGAARTSFLKKCERDAGASAASASCESRATEKKLAGAAKASHIKKCVNDAIGN